MGAMRQTKTGLGGMLELVKRLRAEGDGVAQEPLPDRWIDLVRYLDEKERRADERYQAEHQMRAK